MANKDKDPNVASVAFNKVVASVQRAFEEFLTIPILIILGFLALAAISYYADRFRFPFLQPVILFLQKHIFTDAQATTTMLSTVAGSLITVTSITITLLLLVVQQTASAFTTQVFDQFLSRSSNRIVFGFFIGVSLFTLITLATVDAPFNPVIGGSLAFLLTVMALTMLIFLFYSTINQMRPPIIIDAIHSHTLKARRQQLGLVRYTRRSSETSLPVARLVRAVDEGFITRVDLDLLNDIINRYEEEIEIVLLVSIGTFVAYQDPLAEIKMQQAGGDKLDKIEAKLHQALFLADNRNIAADPAYGIEQLVSIAWTSTSPSKSNPNPGLLTVYRLRDLLSRWAIHPKEPVNPIPIPVVYHDDVYDHLMSAFEDLAVISSASLQHMVFTEVIHSLAMIFDRLPSELQQRASDIIMRILTAMGDHVLTHQLDVNLSNLVRVLNECSFQETAIAVRQAQVDMRQAIGSLSSSNNRVPEEV